MTLNTTPRQPAAPDAARVTADGYRTAFPEADGEAIEAHLNIVMAGVQLAQAVARHLAAYDGSFTVARYSTLRALYFAPDDRLPHSEIARRMGTTAGNISQLIDGLEKAGLVERVASPTSRRVVYVQLTAQGRAVCDELVPSMVRLMEATCAMFTADEKADLARLLRTFRSHLQTR